MPVGIDSYSYHRFYGDVRPGEDPPAATWELGPDPVLEHARSLGVDAVFLETCFLRPGVPVGGTGFSWGHPWPPGELPGLDAGCSPAAEDDLARWIDLAAALGHPLMRITCGGPTTRLDEPAGDLLPRLVGPLRRAADHAAGYMMALAIENHADLRAAELAQLLELTERDNLGVCFDNVNAVRMGDDMVAAARVLASRTLLVQLKDCPDGELTMRALGEGDADLRGILDALGAGGYDGAVCVELASLGPGPVDELAMIERSVAWLRKELT